MKITGPILKWMPPLSTPLFVRHMTHNFTISDSYSFIPLWWSASLSLDLREKSLWLTQLCLSGVCQWATLLYCCILTLGHTQRQTEGPLPYSEPENCNYGRVYRLSFNLHGQEQSYPFTFCPDNRLNLKVLPTTGCLRFGSIAKRALLHISFLVMPSAVVRRLLWLWRSFFWVWKNIDDGIMTSWWCQQ